MDHQKRCCVNCEYYVDYGLEWECRAEPFLEPIFHDPEDPEDSEYDPNEYWCRHWRLAAGFALSEDSDNIQFGIPWGQAIPHDE